MTHTKKFNNLFTKFRKELLPDVIKNCENLSNDQQQSLGNVNDFFLWFAFSGRVGRPSRSLSKSLGKHYIQGGKMLAHYYMEGTQMENQVPFVLSELCANLSNTVVVKSLAEW